MLKHIFSSFAKSVKSSWAEVSTHVVSFLSLQIMRFSIQTALKLAIVLFFPNLAFMAQPVIFTV